MSHCFRIDEARHEFPPGVGEPDPNELVTSAPSENTIPLGGIDSRATKSLRTYLPTEIGDGYWDWIEIGPGLLLSITDASYRRPHRMVVRSKAETIKIRIVCSGSFFISDGAVTVADGTAIIHRIEPRTNKEYVIDTRASPLRMVVIHASPQALRRLGVTSEALPPSICDSFNFSETADSFSPIQASLKLIQISREIIESRDRFGGELRQTYVKGKSYELLSEAILRLNPATELRSSGHRFRHSDIVRLHEAKRAIFGNLENSMTIDQIARLVAISRTKLTIGFRAVFGESIQEFRTRVRLSEAIRMIECTEFSMAEIGQRIGYEHASNFSQFVMQHTGTAPHVLRRKIKQHVQV